MPCRRQLPLALRKYWHRRCRCTRAFPLSTTPRVPSLRYNFVVNSLEWFWRLWILKYWGQTILHNVAVIIRWCHRMLSWRSKIKRFRRFDDFVDEISRFDILLEEKLFNTRITIRRSKWHFGIHFAIFVKINVNFSRYDYVFLLRLCRTTL